jgi:PHD/YefM family antitoxin component YafN of YafNO toxin-antitoxin module
MRVPVESDPNLAILLDAAQQEPVFIERGDQSVAVVLSAEHYDRLTGAANQDFQEFCDAVSDRAIAQGLTEAKLNDLLNHA